MYHAVGTVYSSLSSVRGSLFLLGAFSYLKRNISSRLNNIHVLGKIKNTKSDLLLVAHGMFVGVGCVCEFLTL